MSLSFVSKASLGLFLLLSACKTTAPSEVISNTVVSGLKSHTEAIDLLEKQTTTECKTDSFIANLNALKAQTENLVGQVKSISQSCKTEKQVIYQGITIRNIIIGVLAGILGLIVFLFLKKKVF